MSRRDGDGLGGRSTAAPWLLLVFGLVALYPATLQPLLLMREVGAWEEVPCTVVESRLGSTGEAGLARLVFRYQYSIDGRVYQGTRHDLGYPGITRSQEGAEQIVRANPVGTLRHCRVNPRQPTEAIADPDSADITAGIWFLASPGFLLAGAWMFYRRSRGGPRSSDDGAVPGAKGRSPASGRRIVDLGGTHLATETPPAGFEIRRGHQTLDVTWKSGPGLTTSISLGTIALVAAILGRSSLPMMVGSLVSVSLAGYLGLAAWLGRTHLALASLRLRVTHGPLPFPNTGTVEILQSGILDIVADRPRGGPGGPFALHAELDGGETRVLVGGLTREQATFLHHELRHALGLG